MARSGGRGRRVSTRAWAIHPAYFICCCTVFEACLCMSAICHAFHPGGWEWARACGIFCALRPVGLRQQSRAYWCQIRCCCGYTRCGNDYFRYLPAEPALPVGEEVEDVAEELRVSEVGGRGLPPPPPPPATTPPPMTAQEESQWQADNMTTEAHRLAVNAAQLAAAAVLMREVSVEFARHHSERGSSETFLYGTS